MHVSRKKRIMLLFISFIHSSTFPRSFRKRMRSEKTERKEYFLLRSEFSLFSIQFFIVADTDSAAVSMLYQHSSWAVFLLCEKTRKCFNSTPSERVKRKKTRKTLIDFDCVLHKFKRQKNVSKNFLFFSSSSHSDALHRRRLAHSSASIHRLSAALVARLEYPGCRATNSIEIKASAVKM